MTKKAFEKWNSCMQKQLPEYFTEPEGSLDFVDLKLRNSLP